MSHRGADDLSSAIDHWLARDARRPAAGKDHVLDALESSLRPVVDDAVRERVRRRLATASPQPRSPHELLVERAFDEVVRIQERIRADEYVPWTAVFCAAALVAVAVGLAVWLNRRSGTRLA
ncbi:MAG: hypothetical protein ABR573_11560 [Candidatus Dormibacteria bacterium]